MAPIEYHARTHSGMVRDHNEDNIYSNADVGLWIVADGMGGHACGEVASEIVVKQLCLSFEGGEPLESAIGLAHQAVTAHAEKNPQAKGMGATVVAMSSLNGIYDIAWVGDSRAYRLRDNAIELLTRDHSYLEWLKDNGITVEEARKHPKRNVITQSIGVGEPTPDRVSGNCQPGDRYLLCSDGLNDELTDEEIFTILHSSANSDIVTQQLVDAALEKGGRDNVSVIVVDIEPERRKISTSPAQSIKKLYEADSVKSVWLPIISGVLAAVVFAVAMTLFK